MHYKSLLLLFSFAFFSCGNNSENQEKTSDMNKTAESAEKVDTEKTKNILFFGNSLTAGYGLEDPSTDGFTALIQKRIDSLGLNYKVINAGLSGETTAGGSERVGWVLRQPVDIFVLELGGNDGLRGIAPSSSKDNLQSIINTVKEKYPEAKIILAGMEAPPNMGQKFTSEFREMYPKLASENNTSLIPFFLKDVGGIPEMNQRDGIHPNEAGQKILVENVWEILKDLL